MIVCFFFRCKPKNLLKMSSVQNINMNQSKRIVCCIILRWKAPAWLGHSSKLHVNRKTYQSFNFQTPLQFVWVFFLFFLIRSGSVRYNGEKNKEKQTKKHIVRIMIIVLHSAYFPHADELVVDNLKAFIPKFLAILFSKFWPISSSL